MEVSRVIKVAPAAEERTARALEKHGLANGVCLSMTYEDKELGYAVYTRAGDTATLAVLHCPDEPDLVELLVRAALNSALLRGAVTMRFTDPAIVPRLDVFGFDKTEDGLSTEIDAFFNRPCSGGSASCGDCRFCAEKGQKKA